MGREVVSLLGDATYKIWSVILDYIPNMISAFIFIVIGFFLARVISSFFEYIMKRIRLDTVTAKFGINEILFRIGMGKSPSKILRIIIYWIVMLIFIASATSALKLNFISNILETFLIKFIPRVVAAIIIGFVGIVISKVIEDIVYNAAIANNLRAGKMFSKIISTVVLVFTSIIVIEQLGLDIKLLRSSINILFASLGLGFALAVGISFGLGAKDIAKNFLESVLSDRDTRNQ
ncbi:MAG: mechanosensitive ion channel family protein [Elusimicrobiales bacterium]